MAKISSAMHQFGRLGTVTIGAKEILRAGLPETAFSWHPVRQEVGSSKYQMPDAIDPI